ncbi:MAG TPA: diacylglycerol kinase family protein [Cyclobacteriaceae bacterium]|nr:diacylglycerol kinase family protein [Cyclobacteriaceae bacterium]
MKFIMSFKYAFQGLMHVFKTQRNMQVHVFIAILVALAAYAFSITTTEWLVVILFYALVLAAEVINTAIEKLVDLVHPEINPEAGKIKDIAAAAVLLTAIMAIIAGLIIFIPYLQIFFNGAD